MKNRLICLALCLVMLLSVFLTSCGEKDIESTKNEILIESSENARTLTMWLVSEKAMDPAVVEAVTKALNNITETKFSTRLVLKFFTEDQYRAAVTDEIRRNEDARNPLLGGSNSGSSSATDTAESIEYITNEYGQFQKKYPELKENQVDIIYIAGRDMYVEFIENGWLSPLDSELSSSSKKIKEYISSTLLNAAKIEGSTYAIPNNNAIGEYTYMLLDKKLMEECSMDGIYHQGKINGFYNEYVFNYLQTVREHYGDQIVPVDATYEECLDLLAHYWTINPDDYSAQNSGFSLFGYRYTDPATLNRTQTVLAFNSLFGDPVFCENFNKINEFRLDGGYFGEAVEGKPTAVQFVKGNITDYEKYAEDYYPVIVKYPTVNVEDVYENMLGVCSYAGDLSRCMQIVTYLNTNVEFRNILQYGVEGEHFQFVVDEEGDKIVERLSDAYMVDIFKMGNAFLAYLDPTEEGITKDIWEIAKQQNRQALIEPLLNFDFQQVVKDSAKSSASTPKLGSLGYTYTFTTGYSKEILSQDPLLKKFFEESDAAGKGVYVYHTSKVSGQNLSGMIYYYNNNISNATVEVTDGDGALSVNYSGTAGGGENITVINFYGKKNSSNLLWNATVNGEAAATKTRFQNSILDFNFMETDTYTVELATKLTKAMIYENDVVYAFVNANGSNADPKKPVLATYEKTIGEGENAQKRYTYFFFIPEVTNVANVTVQPTGSANKLDLAVSYTTDQATALGSSDPKYAMFLVTVTADATVTEVNFNLTVDGDANAVTPVTFEKDPEISICGDLDTELVRFMNRLTADVEELLAACTDINQFREIVADLNALLTVPKFPGEEYYSIGSKLKTTEVQALFEKWTSEGFNATYYFFWNLHYITSKTAQVHKEDLEGEGKYTEVDKHPVTGESYHYFSSPYMIYFGWLKENGFAK
ncbi:MAG: hypothetical protein E7620_04915 [Ruminococcaceae bacterium]|nr:hypothetical protein [Oscillospiraceae bacterium]